MLERELKALLVFDFGFCCVLKADVLDSSTFVREFVLPFSTQASPSAWIPSD